MNWFEASITSAVSSVWFGLMKLLAMFLPIGAFMWVVFLGTQYGGTGFKERTFPNLKKSEQRQSRRKPRRMMPTRQTVNETRSSCRLACRRS